MWPGWGGGDRHRTTATEEREMESKHKIHIFNLVNDIKFIWTSLCPFSFWNLPLRSEGDSLLSKVNLTLCPLPYFLLSLLDTQFLFHSELFAPSTNILQSANFKRSSLECLKSLCYFLIFPFPLNFLKVCLYLVSAFFFLLRLLLTFYFYFSSPELFWSL